MAVKNGKQNKLNLTDRSVYSNRNLWSGILFGIGLAAFIDETVFHQLLRWHHFYDKSTTDIGLISDGLFHAFSWFATIGGLFIFADLRRRHVLSIMKWWGGVLIGAGGFQLYDGIIHHKVMRVHQVRYVENVLIYDLMWNLIGVLMIIIGFIFLGRTRSRQQPGEEVSHEHQ